MNRFLLNPQDTVLLIIDLQDRLMNAMPDREKVIKNTGLLIAAAQQMGMPVIITEQYPRGLGNTVAEIKNQLGEHGLVEKVSFSACLPELQQMLQAKGRKTVVVAGTETHVCVFQTVRDLTIQGYNVHVVRDAVCSRFVENYANGLELMKDAGAVISNTETVIFDLLKMAGTPAFKVLSPLIK
jgi:nicotinamidase-related amidase